MRQSDFSLAITCVALAGSGLIGGCATPSTRTATALTRHGLDPVQSLCVGDRLEASLSIGQLQRLGRAARAVNAGDTTPGRLTTSDLLRVSTQINDVAVPIEVAKAAAGCGVIRQGLR